jgi:hypothetical protein
MRCMHITAPLQCLRMLLTCSSAIAQMSRPHLEIHQHAHRQAEAKERWRCKVLEACYVLDQLQSKRQGEEMSSYDEYKVV